MAFTPKNLEAISISEARERNALSGKILEKLMYSIGKDTSAAKPHDWTTATILVIRDKIIDQWMKSTKDVYRTSDKRVYYLSLEFLIGRLMRDAILNLGLMQEVSDALKSLGVDVDVIAELEPDAALGNGGLGRLAACFMESMATVGIPAYGYGIRYVHGLFRQEIHDGWQVELPETWLQHGNPWEFERRESNYEIGFGGSVAAIEGEDDADGDGDPNDDRHQWKPSERVIAVAYDTPVVGWKSKRVNTLRLWEAQPIDAIKLDAFNSGDHIGALNESNKAELITRVLYPADSTPAGQELRLRQEYFFVSASLQDILRRHLQQYPDFLNLPDKVAIQLNDTHPAVGVLELMRLLMDLHEIKWEKAWEITKGTFGYTNHTLLPEALETWPVHLFERMLPRHMQILYAINAKVIIEARRDRGFDDQQVQAISLIDESHGRRVRMGPLAFVGSHSTNGVSALHTDLMKKTVFADLHKLYPDRINNKTNGITPRRWLNGCNPGLTSLIREAIGDAFLDDAEGLSALEPFAEDAGFRAKFAAVKHANKVRLAAMVRQRTGIRIDPKALFDIQIKRIHEYKRQLLNIIETVALYDAIRAQPHRNWAPRVKFFGGKAAPTYWNAKLIIKLANDVARVINGDPAVRGLLKVVFVPNYNVSTAEIMIPGANLSEQISTAGLEASGTGNMKFALNGAITIGTLDGANVEISEHVGDDNIFIFGLTAEQVAELRLNGYKPRDVIEASPGLSEALSQIAAGVFSPDDVNRYKDMVQGLYDHDWFLVAADFDAYFATQRHVDKVWGDQQEWNRIAVLNTARVGWFSSDRTIRQYGKEIWNVAGNSGL
jgi:glycogen phosphorylase